MSARIREQDKMLHLRTYAGLLNFLASNPEAIKTFENDTGHYLPTITSPIDAMIDRATGRDRKIFEAFAGWAAKQYGLRFLPDNYLELIMKPKE